MRFVGAMVLAALLGAAAFGQRAEVLYQAAQKKEDVDGDLKAAVEGYRKVVTAAGSNRGLAAQALVRIGECHEKLGSTEAHKAYLQVVGQYADQSEAVARARVRLAALGGSRGTGVSLRQFYDPKAKPDVVLWNVSADGRYAGATDYETGNAAVVELATGKSWNITDYGKWNNAKGFIDQAAISRDGKQVAFWHYHDGAKRGELRVAGADGKSDRTLYRAKEPEKAAEWGVPTDWSPDGKWIVVQLERGNNQSLSEGVTDFVLLPAAGGEPRVVKTAEYTRRYRPRIVFSPDGRYLAYDYPARKELAQGDIFILPVEGGVERAVAAHPAQEQFVGWAPDGSIVFSSDRTGAVGLYRVQVSDGRQTGEPELLRPGLGNLFPLGITRSGTLYYQQEITQHNAYIASLDFSTGKLVSPHERITQRINDATAGPSWSADGTKLAYLHMRSEGSAPTVVIRGEDHSEERELLPEARLLDRNSMARWHPDGRSLLALATKDNKRGLYWIHAATGEASLVWQGMGIFDWSADGRWIFRQGGDERRSIVRIDTATREEKIIHTGDSTSRGYRVSPDGGWLAFRQQRRGGKDYLAVTSTDGGPAKQLAEPFPLTFEPLGMVWSADGRWVAGVQEQKGESTLWVVPAEGGQARQTELTVKGSLAGLNVHPDGKRIAYSVSSRRFEYWMIENFLVGSR